MSKFIGRGGEMVDDKTYDKRMKICESCPHFGKVDINFFDGALPVSIKMEGCTICGCPAATKLRMKVIMRDPEYLGVPLTAKEVVKNQFEGKKLLPEVVRCSNYKEEDFWKEIEK